MPKARREKTTKPLRHNPLAEEIIEDESTRNLRKTPRVKSHRNVAEADEDQVDTSLPSRITRKVLEMAQKQKDEEDNSATLGAAGLFDDDGAGSAMDSHDVGMGEDEDFLDVEVDKDGYIVTHNTTEEDERALSLFMPKGGASGMTQGATLADVILKKIHEHESRQNSDLKEEDPADSALSPKVIQVYSEIGTWLKTYKVGKIPKAFKVLPSLTNWEEVLSLTSPLTWSPAAMYEAVNIFASNLNPKMAQRFFNLVLLPAVRQDIADKGKLNFHYYRALRKALFKPAAFFKGILLPLAVENCALREAMILSSVLAKASIPPMHVAAALVRLSEMSPWYGTTSILIAALVNKKYALPLRVIESLATHFCSFGNEHQDLPLVWHRGLLVFVQRYKFDLTDDQRRRLKELLRVHCHEGIGAEVRRELTAPKPGEAPPASMASMDVDM